MKMPHGEKLVQSIVLAIIATWAVLHGGSKLAPPDLWIQWDDPYIQDRGSILTSDSIEFRSKSKIKLADENANVIIEYKRRDTSTATNCPPTWTEVANEPPTRITIMEEADGWWNYFLNSVPLTRLNLTASEITNVMFRVYTDYVPPSTPVGELPVLVEAPQAHKPQQQN